MKAEDFKIKRNGTRVLVKGRMSFVHLDAPRAAAQGSDPKYSATVIIPKSETEIIKELNAAISQAVDEGTVKLWKGQKPNVRSSNFKFPLKDGDVERPDDEAFKGCMFFNASSKSAVPTLNKIKEPIDPVQVYSGCYAIASVNFYAFDMGSKGIAGGLNAVMKVAEGEKLGGSGSGERDFDALDFDDEDMDLDGM